MDTVTAGLLLILVAVLLLPFAWRPVEEHLEAFLFAMGLVASGLAGALTRDLVVEALTHPVAITVAVLTAGLLFYALEHRLRGAVGALLRRVPLPALVCAVVAVLGLLSSVITAIIASLVLVEVMRALPLGRGARVSVTVLACFAIGLGAALTPIGEPLATIAVVKLDEDFYYLLRLLGRYAVPGVLAFAVAAAVAAGRSLAGRAAQPAADTAQPARAGSAGSTAAAASVAAAAAAAADPAGWPGAANPSPAHAPPGERGGLREVLGRAARVYVFIMGLVLLGEGFKPLIERYLIPLDSRWLFWLNMISAVVDNATLTAAEIDARMSDQQVRAVLMGLLVSGGMLVPGNIPNIIAANRLRIGSREWARIGVPVGLVGMAAYFLALFLP